MAKSGDTLTDFITAPWYNKVERAVGPNLGGGLLPSDLNNHYVTVYNHSTTAKTKWEAVAYGTPKLDYEVPLGPAHEEFAFNTVDIEDLTDFNKLAILQEPLAGRVGASAKALLSGVSWVKTDAPDTSLTKLTGSAGGLIWSSSGRIEALESYEYETDTWISLCVISILASGSNAKLFKTPPGGIAARSGTTVGSASCTEWKIVGSTLTTNTETIIVKNVDAVALPGDTYLLAVKESISDFYIAQHPGIINLRLSGSNLQYTLDGTTWTTWTTGTTCP